LAHLLKRLLKIWKNGRRWQVRVDDNAPEKMKK
jgi:hypothetical protein